MRHFPKLAPTPRVEAQIVTDGSSKGLFWGIGDGTDAYHVANVRSSVHKQAWQMPYLGQVLKVGLAQIWDVYRMYDLRGK